MPKSRTEDEQRRIAYGHFRWLHWLSESEPNCELAKQALDKVWKENPDFEPRYHPDFTHYLEVGSAVPERAWSADELRARPASEWVADLLSFLEGDWLVPGRYDLLLAVEEAATRDFGWGLDLADTLAESGNWDTDLWRYLMSAWSRELEPKHREVLERLSMIELYPKHAGSVADALRALVKQGGLPYAPNLLQEANEIAVAIWDSLDRTETLSETDNWLGKAINHPAGSITEFWLESLSLWGKQQDPSPDALGDDYQTALCRIVQDNTLVGRLGKAVLARYLRFILAVDEKWTRENLIPSFENTDDEDYCALWHGLVCGGPVSPQMAEALEDAFLNAVLHKETLFPNEGKLREAFIGFYSLMIAYFDEDPIDSWIPKFFETVELEDRVQFARQIGHTLNAMDDTKQKEWWQRWLRRYWENRLQGVPALLAPDEIHAMLGWLPYLRGVYPDAVDLAIRMEPVSLKNSLVAHQINTRDLWQQHTHATAKLLIHLGHSETPLWAWHGGKELVDKLLQTDLPQDLKTELDELVARLGPN